MSEAKEDKIKSLSKGNQQRCTIKTLIHDKLRFWMSHFQV